MKPMRWKSLMALMFAFALAASACSGDEAADTSAGGDTDSTEASGSDEEMSDEEMSDEEMSDEEMSDEEMAGDGGPVTITGPERTDEEAGAIQDALSAWGEENGIEISYVGSADWEAEINVAVEAGNAPDISIFPQPGKLADFANAGHIVPLSDDVAASVAGNWDESWLSFGNVDGTQFGVPVKSDLKSLVWYKPGRFAELGYEVPESYDALLALTDQAIADGNTPWCIGIESGQATGWPFTDWIEDIMLRTAGADVYDQWVNHEIPFDDPAVVTAFETVGDLWNTPDAVFAAGGSITATGFGAPNAEALANDDCLMHRQANFFASFIPEGTPIATDDADAINVFYFPQIGDTRPVLAAGTLAAAFNDRHEVAMVLEYMGTPEYANARQAAQKERKGGGDTLSGFLSAVQGADTSLYAPLEVEMLDILASAEVTRFDGSDLMPSAVGAGTFWTAATSFVNGDLDAAAATAEVEASWP